LSFSSGGAQPPSDLTIQAVETAERLGNPKVLARALRCRHDSLWSLATSESLHERIALAKKLIQVAHANGLGEIEFRARLSLLLDFWESGDARGLDGELEACARLANALRQPRLMWIETCVRAIRMLSRGDLVEAERLAHEAVSKGEGANDLDVASYFGVFMFSLNDLRGRLSEFESDLRARSERFVGSEDPGLRCALLYIRAEAQDFISARQGLADLASRGFGDLFAGHQRLLGLAQLAQVCATIGAVEHAAQLYDLLLPYAERNVLLGGPVTVYFGPVAHELGLLALLMGRVEDALAYFEQAARMETALGARPYLARTRFEQAGALLRRNAEGDRESARNLFTHVLQDAKGMGMDGLAAKAEAALGELAASGAEVGYDAMYGTSDRRGPPGRGPERVTGHPGHEAHSGRSAGLSPPHRPTTGRECVFRRDGQVWSVGDPANPIRLKDTKGLRCLHHLISRPGQETHVMDLIALFHPSDSEQEEEQVRGALRGAVDEGVDAQARRAYANRIRDLREELSEAQRLSDLGRVDRLRAEIEFLSRQLTLAYGLGGRRRTARTPVERARVSITKVINRSILHVSEHDRHLGDCLKSTIRTGTFCRYEPDPYAPIRWRLGNGEVGLGQSWIADPSRTTALLPDDSDLHDP
jgi:tetratricopeptide (TPR) repeat protein